MSNLDAFAVARDVLRQEGIAVRVTSDEEGPVLVVNPDDNWHSITVRPARFTYEDRTYEGVVVEWAEFGGITLDEDGNGVRAIVAGMLQDADRARRMSPS